MQDEIEQNKKSLELLNLRLAELEAEREHIQKELQCFSSSEVKSITTGLRSRATVATMSALAMASLLYLSGFHNAQSSVKNNDEPEDAVISALEKAQIVRANRLSSPYGNYAGVKAASERQWGPALVMPEAEPGKRYYGFDSLVKQQQENLMTLGFELGKADGFKGPGTQRAIAEFRALYLPNSAKQLKDADLAVIINNYANLARRDAARYGIDHGIVAAIRLSSVRTGVDFSYLMKLAATESNFEPVSEAATSSATGLYQFTRDTWLKTLKMHGAKYDVVADYVSNIEFYETRSGYQRPVVRDESLYQHLLELRKNPRLSSMMAAETVLEHQQKLAHTLDREPTETDLYLAHFLGIDNATTFLKSLKQSPDKHAVELFPMAASSNRDIFHPRTCEPRTVDEVYALFDEKFSSRRYDDFAAN